MTLAHPPRGGDAHALGRAFDATVDAVHRAQIVLREYGGWRTTAKNAAMIEQVKTVAVAGGEA